MRFADAEPSELKQITFLATRGKSKKLTDALHDIWSSVQMADVLDAKSDEPRYDLFLISFGDGTLFEHGTTNVAASISQHGFDPQTMPKADVTAFIEAWKRDSKRLKLAGWIRFD